MKIEVRIFRDPDVDLSVIAARFGKNFGIKASFRTSHPEELAVAVRSMLEQTIENHAAIRDALAEAAE